MHLSSKQCAFACLSLAPEKLMNINRVTRYRSKKLLQLKWGADFFSGDSTQHSLSPACIKSLVAPQHADICTTTMNVAPG